MNKGQHTRRTMSGLATVTLAGLVLAGCGASPSHPISSAKESASASRSQPAPSQSAPPPSASASASHTKARAKKAPAKSKKAPKSHAAAPHTSAPVSHTTAPAPHTTAPAPHSTAPTPHSTPPVSHSTQPPAPKSGSGSGTSTGGGSTTGAISTPGWSWQFGGSNRIADIAANWTLAWLQEKNWGAVSASANAADATSLDGAWTNGITVLPQDGGTNHVIWQPVAIQIGTGGPNNAFIVQVYVRSVNSAGAPTLAQGLTVSDINYGGNQVGWNARQSVKAPSEYAMLVADINIQSNSATPVTGWVPQFMLTPIGSTTSAVQSYEQISWIGLGTKEGAATYQ